MLASLADRFELLRQVGAGGFGVVYEARDRRDGSSVAVKLLTATSVLAETRFDREAVLLAELRHPSLVRYVAHGRAENGQAFLAMEWLAGYTLEDRLRRRPL